MSLKVENLEHNMAKLTIEVRYISENDLRKSEVKNDKIKKN